MGTLENAQELNKIFHDLSQKIVYIYLVMNETESNEAWGQAEIKQMQQASKDLVDGFRAAQKIIHQLVSDAKADNL